MLDERLGSLHLKGDASVDFFNKLFRLTENIENHTYDDGIVIRKVDDGYIVTIDDFNLYFVE